MSDNFRNGSLCLAEKIILPYGRPCLMRRNFLQAGIGAGWFCRERSAAHTYCRLRQGWRCQVRG